MPSAGFGGDRFIIPQGLAHALFTGVGYEYSFFQSKKNCQSFGTRRRNTCKAPVASDIISTRSAT
jgi:hypothetical protein